MKILDIYTKKDLDILNINGVSISDIMNNYFNSVPSNYRINYDKNLDTLELWHIDEHYEEALAEYLDIHNLIIYKDINSIIHELFHMAARDYISKNNGFVKSCDDILFESALLEGCAEFLSSKSLNCKPTDYYFEVFSVDMLSNIDDFFEPYFVASYDKFINLFPNKRDILSLMYSLSFYAKNFCSIYVCEDIDRDIYLSFGNKYKNDKIYSDKFLSLLSDKDLSCCLSEVWEDYFKYADKQIKTRVLRSR